jgi:hypothetical protein
MLCHRLYHALVALCLYSFSTVSKLFQPGMYRDYNLQICVQSSYSLQTQIHLHHMFQFVSTDVRLCAYNIWSLNSGRDLPGLLTVQYCSWHAVTYICDLCSGIKYLTRYKTQEAKKLTCKHSTEDSHSHFLMYHKISLYD